MSRDRLPGLRGGSVELLSSLVVAAMVVALSATTAIVYVRLADELVATTEESIAQRVLTLDNAIVAELTLAADEAGNLMATTADPVGSDSMEVRRRLAKIQQALTGCSAAWIVPEGGAPLAALGTTPPSLPAGRDWWRPYAISESPRRSDLTRAYVGAHQTIALVARPFRGDTGIGTILPIAVPYAVGTPMAMTAFFEIDITTILNDMLNEIGRRSGAAYPMELAFYDSSGALVETTRNLPKVTERPFAGAPGARSGELKLGSVLDYLFPAGKSIEVRRLDERLDLVCAGRVPAPLVMANVRRTVAKVLLVSMASLIAVVVLGLMAVRASRTARNFEREQLLARFEALQAKVNPHFLFNTLDSMIGVVESGDRPTLMRMLRALSSMLHATVRRGEDIVSLVEELDYVRNYLAIQQVRYRDRLTWNIESDESTLETPVCSFGLQPLVENCLTHGIGRGGIDIAIVARRAGDAVEIEVRDDGAGCPPETRAALALSFSETRNHLGREGGLFSVHYRARLAFGAPWGLELGEPGPGFSVTLRLPALTAAGPRWPRRARRERG